MANIWVISDTHFNHANILKFTKPDGSLVREGFQSLEEMNETLIQRWNNTVYPGDKVYHLGDVYFGSKDKADEILGRLNGKKRLILGNHDRSKCPVLYKHFEKIYMWRMFTDEGLLLTHAPVHPSTLREGRFKEKSMINVHGHIHADPSPEGPYRNVSVEQTDYFPVHIDELTINRA